MNRRPTDSGEPPDGPDPDSTLERLLERNRFRTPPPEWREAILSMAEAPANDEAVVATPSPEV
ncbi:MAG: hypothetical protein JNL97_12890, partial [Verrucomicrobiales bacterium]|nr:hypothetical protein [Verrucomicrobiales bacterium]